MSNSILIYNPQCSKSKEAKKILEDLGIEFDLIDYLQEGLSEQLISSLPHLLGLPFNKIIREKEAIYTELKIAEKNISALDWITILRLHPVLLERPLFIFNKKAIIGRPPSLIKSFLSKN